MAKSYGGICGGKGGDSAECQLSEEILSVIPEDPFEQLELARKITSLAIASGFSNMEAKVEMLRHEVVRKDQAITDLENRLAEMEHRFQDSDGRLRDSIAENVKLTSERDTLSLTAKKLARDLAKMENFKRRLMQSLKEDGTSQAEVVDIRTYEQPISEVPSWKDEGSMGGTSANILKESAKVTSDQIVSRPLGVRSSSITPYITPRLTPTSTSPTKPRLEGHSSLSTWHTPSEQSSAANSPPRGNNLPGRTPRIDGKEFFRQARSRLSYEQFGAFLLNIKELNAHRQSREDTLKRAEEIFGTENKDLFVSFQSLLNRTLS